jgi:hypothetical protein
MFGLELLFLGCVGAVPLAMQDDAKYDNYPSY